MKAVPYGKDGLTGDSFYQPSNEEALDATEDSTFAELFAAYKAQWEAQEDVGEDENGVLVDGVGLPFDDDPPVGFWLMREQDLETALIPGEVECRNDGQTYTVNRVIKTLCQRLAVRLVVPPA